VVFCRCQPENRRLSIRKPRPLLLEPAGNRSCSEQANLEIQTQSIILVDMNKQELAKTHFIKGLECFDAGDWGSAESNFRQSLDLAPDRVSALTKLAATLIKKDRPAEALPYAKKAVAIDSKAVEAWMILGICNHHESNFSQALGYYERALRLKPEHAETWSNRGTTLHALGHNEDALTCCQKALDLNPDHLTSWCRHGTILQAMGRHAQALTSFDRALALQSRIPEAWFGRGLSLQILGRHQDALEAFDKALGCNPDDARAWERKGVTLLTLKRYDEALDALDKAVGLSPDFAQAWFNRGNVLQPLNRYDDAVSSYDKAIALNPDLIEAWSVRASIHVSDVDNVERAIDESRKSLTAFLKGVFHAIRANPEGSTFQAFRLKHDLQQAMHLRSRSCQVKGMEDFLEVAQELLEASGRQDNPQIIRPTARQTLAMAPYLETPYFFEMPVLRSSCVNPGNDWKAIEEAYLAGSPEIVQIDNFLSAEALAAFQDYALVSKVWMVEYVNKYLGAFANKGFLSPLHLQLARELARVMPRVFRHHRLSHMWGFKYDETLGRGINVHADFARVNLNFWITPDQCNLDPASGGLKVYDVPSPPDWPYHDYNENQNKIYDFLRNSSAQCVTVPHRCNRAVLFNSALFHETDKIHFKAGYESRRVNMTYLFGWQL